TQGYIAIDIPKKTIYLSFQGAVNPLNWVASLNFIHTQLKYIANPNPDIYVHQGFQNAYESNQVRTKILSSIERILSIYPDFSLHAIGHSYGCSISSLAVIELVSMFRIPAQKVSLTTFGCPRIGNYEFARLIDTDLGLAAVRRVTHSFDRLTRTPPTTFGFRHSGREFF
ncbi:Alpha/Beta hydrolase protein, partial [Chytridium lagenaria]